MCVVALSLRVTRCSMLVRSVVARAGGFVFRRAGVCGVPDSRWPVVDCRVCGAGSVRNETPAACL